jgi:hypothetical protein
MVERKAIFGNEITLQRELYKKRLEDMRSVGTSLRILVEKMETVDSLKFMIADFQRFPVIRRNNIYQFGICNNYK